MFIRILERRPQQTSKVGDHGVSTLDILVQLSRNQVEGVEQKVRLQLRLEKAQLDLRHASVHLGISDLSLCPSPVVAGGVSQGYEADEGEDVIDHALDKKWPYPEAFKRRSVDDVKVAVERHP